MRPEKTPRRCPTGVPSEDNFIPVYSVLAILTCTTDISYHIIYHTEHHRIDWERYSVQHPYRLHLLVREAYQEQPNISSPAYHIRPLTSNPHQGPLALENLDSRRLHTTTHSENRRRRRQRGCTTDRPFIPDPPTQAAPCLLGSSTHY